MIRKTSNGIVAVIALAAALCAAPASQASNPDKHDSNTLHKIGNAIQYPVRKAGENTSVSLHRGENRKSVESMRPQKAAAVVTPNGKKFVVAHRGNARSMYAHRHNYGQYRRTHTYGYYRSHHTHGYFHRHHRRHHHRHHHRQNQQH
jgi:hypothetical protein